MPPEPAAVPLTDVDLAAGVARRDAGALRELVVALHRGLARALAGRGDVNDADLDDFAQEAVLRVIERIEQYRGESRFVTWATAIAVRVAFTHLRTRRWQRERHAAVLFDTAQEPASARAGERDPAARGDRGELLAVLRTSIENELTDRQRATVLKFLSGAPQAVLARELGVTSGAFHKMMHDARMRLRAALERAGFDAATVISTLDAPGSGPVHR